MPSSHKHYCVILEQKILHRRDLLILLRNIHATTVKYRLDALGEAKVLILSLGQTEHP